eukprot:TRINITY_DN1231_c0_g1_i1.p1 TRINITY_DN1231_c0_g1~~TRINITY_DN1231_c0_g1_i1.p1  ORF type:complete len:449 (-),score=76.79 TRINITY_DN1231_c0_g1_i1:142-1488(-)
MLEAVDNEDVPFTTSNEPSSPVQQRSGAKGKRGTFPLNKDSKTLTRIFDNLSVLDLVRISRVCKTWYQVAEQDSLWRKFLPKTVRDNVLPTGVKWKKLYLNRRREFLVSCKQAAGIYIRLDNEVFVAGRGGELSGEVVINLAEGDKLLSPVSLRLFGYEESFGNNSIFLDETSELEVGSYTRRANWNRDCFPLAAEQGLHGFPFSVRIPRVDMNGGPLLPSVDYIWQENLLDSDTFCQEYLLVAKAQFFQAGPLKKSKKITLLPGFSPNEKYSAIRFVHGENVYTSRFPFSNVRLKAALQKHPQITEDGNVQFEVALEVDNFNTNVSGPATVTLYHTAVSEDFVPPELHAPMSSKVFPLQIFRASYGAAPYKVKLEIEVPQSEFWVERIRGPPPAYAQCVHSFTVNLKVSMFTSVSVSLPIEFLRPGDTSGGKTEEEQDMNRPVVQLE